MFYGAGGSARRLAIAALGAVAIALLGACGTTNDEGDDASSSSAPAAATTAAATDAATSAAAATDAASSEASATSAAASEAAPTGEPLKVAFIYNGAVDAQGWDTAMDLGRQAVADELGDQVEVTFKESIPDGPQAGTVLEQLVADGNKLIFTTSFGQQQYVMPLAEKNPDVKFVQVTGLQTAENVASFDASAVEGFYVAGMAAAAASSEPKLGLVGGFPLTNQLAQLNAFTLGAQAINPEATVQVVWTNDWTSLPKAQSAAQGLVDSGVKGLTHFISGPGVAPVAKATSTPWVGFEVDQGSFAPDQYLTSVLFNWAPYFIEQTKAVIDGTWKSDTFYGNMGTGTVALAPWGAAYEALDQATKDKIQAAADGFAAGNPVFVGPITDRDGKERVPAGANATAAEIATMDYVVPGVLGAIPKL